MGTELNLRLKCNLEEKFKLKVNDNIGANDLEKMQRDTIFSRKSA